MCWSTLLVFATKFILKGMVARSRWWQSKSSLLPILALVPVVCFSWSKNIIQMVWYSARNIQMARNFGIALFHSIVSSRYIKYLWIDIYICVWDYIYMIYIYIIAILKTIWSAFGSACACRCCKNLAAILCKFHILHVSTGVLIYNAQEYFCWVVWPPHLYILQLPGT